MNFNGLGMTLGNLSRLSRAKTRSITAENVHGEKGKGGMAEYSTRPQADIDRDGRQHLECNNPCARDLGQKWKLRPRDAGWDETCSASHDHSLASSARARQALARGVFSQQK